MAESMIFQESFTPPDLGATAGCQPPPRILLDLDAYLADRRNATTATATSRHGHPIRVSFYAADPPAISYLCVHCPCSEPDDPAFACEPRVVGAEGRFALLRVRFAHDGPHDEYFMYKADPDSPSLEHVRLPATHRVPRFKQLAVVPLGDGRGNYLLADRCIAISKALPSKYELHIYSSADRTWSIKPLPDVACPDGDAHRISPDKVIALGDGVVGWVDLRAGVAVCDLLREPMDVRFIPLPEPMPANRERLKEFHPGDPWRFRDVAFSNGVLKFVELEHRWIVTTIGPAPEEPADPSEKAVLLDSDLIMWRKWRELETKPKQVRKRDGWRMVTWSRAMSSDCWHRGRVVDVRNIAVDDAVASSLRSGVGDDESFRFRNMYSAFPTLSTDVDDLVYLSIEAETTNDSKAWMVAVDLGKNTLTALGAYSFAGRHDPCAYNNYRLSSLSNYLNMDPDSSHTAKLKDSTDPLKTRQFGEEASCPHKGKPRDPVKRRLEKIEAKKEQRSVREHGGKSNEECGSDSSGPLPAAESHRNCLPPRPVIKQSDGAGGRPNPAPADVRPVNNFVARPTGSSLLPQAPPQQDLGRRNGAGNHPNARAVNHPNADAFNHPNAHAANHHLHGATGLSRSCPPPQLVPQQNMSNWNVVSYQKHPWPPHQQQWNGVAGGNQEHHHPFTHGVNQNHWNAAAGHYDPPLSANENLQNQWGAPSYGGYGHYSAPNLPAYGNGMHPAPAGQFPKQPGVLAEQLANQRRGAPEQWPAGSGGGAAQAWTPRKRWRGAG